MTTTTTKPSLSGSRGELTRVPLALEGVPEVDLTATPPPGRWAEFGSRFGRVRMHLRETPCSHPGAGTAVHLHGLGGSSSNWTDLAGVLSARLRSVALDLPGFGRSEPPEGFDFSRHGHRHVVARFLEDLGAGPVHLVGNSFGGAVAIEVAAAHPELVASVTLISPAMPDLRLDPRRVSDGRLLLVPLPFIGPRVRRRLTEVPPHERARRLLRLCFADPGAVPPHRVDEAAAELAARDGVPWAEPALGRTTTELLRSWFRPPSLWGLLRRIHAPSLVVWGSQDRVVSARKAPRTAQTLPRGRLLMLPRTGHVAQMERPRVVARAILAMVDDDHW